MARRRSASTHEPGSAEDRVRAIGLRVKDLYDNPDTFDLGRLAPLLEDVQACTGIVDHRSPTKDPRDEWLRSMFAGTWNALVRRIGDEDAVIACMTCLGNINTYTDKAITKGRVANFTVLTRVLRLHLRSRGVCKACLPLLEIMVHEELFLDCVRQVAAIANQHFSNVGIAESVARFFHSIVLDRPQNADVGMEYIFVVTMMFMHHQNNAHVVRHTANFFAWLAATPEHRARLMDVVPIMKIALASSLGMPSGGVLIFEACVQFFVRLNFEPELAAALKLDSLPRSKTQGIVQGILVLAHKNFGARHRNRIAASFEEPAVPEPESDLGSGSESDSESDSKSDSESDSDPDTDPGPGPGPGPGPDLDTATKSGVDGEMGTDPGADRDAHVGEREASLSATVCSLIVLLCCLFGAQMILSAFSRNQALRGMLYAREL